MHQRATLAGVLAVLRGCFAVSLVCTCAAGQKEGPARPDPKTQSSPMETRAPFRAGERLEYRVLWSSFSLNAAILHLSVNERRPFYGRDAWHFQALARTVDAMRLLFPLDDQFDSYAEPDGLASLQYETYLREQGKTEDRIYRMSTDGDPAPRTGVALRVLPGTRDPVGLLFYFRTVDWRHHKEVRCPVFDGRKLYQVEARLELERGEVMVPAGKYAASRIHVRVFERNKELDQTSFSVWLAQDAGRTPVLLEAEIPLGSARVELTRVAE